MYAPDINYAAFFDGHSPLPNVVNSARARARITLPHKHAHIHTRALRCTPAFNHSARDFGPEKTFVAAQGRNIRSDVFGGEVVVMTMVVVVGWGGAIVFLCFGALHAAPSSPASGPAGLGRAS